MIGLTRYDDNQVINDYKAQFGITNPCAGQEGGAGEAIDIIIEGQPFFGAPTYCVVCPDRKLHFNVCFPPTPECFDDFIFSCGATNMADYDDADQITIYPNPASEIFTLSTGNTDPKKIEIVDMVGKIVKSISPASGIQNTAVQISNLQSGMYFIRVETGDGIITKKLSVK